MREECQYPKVRYIAPDAGRTLRVEFENGVTKIYDCAPLLDSEAFRPLRQDAIFRLVHPDPHGYGAIWTDEIDLAESELWINGKLIR